LRDRSSDVLLEAGLALVRAPGRPHENDVELAAVDVLPNVLAERRAPPFVLAMTIFAPEYGRTRGVGRIPDLDARGGRHGTDRAHVVRCVRIPPRQDSRRAGARVGSADDATFLPENIGIVPR